MKITSAEANKMLKQLEDTKETILKEEQNYKTYHAAVGEDEKALRPEYNFHETQGQIETHDREIMALRHALNVFNSTTEVGDTGLTIDQVLIRLPQLQSQKAKLRGMRSLPTKNRYNITGGVIDYIYTSYDPTDAQMEYEAVDAEITMLQLALDKVNTTKTFEVF